MKNQLIDFFLVVFSQFFVHLWYFLQHWEIFEWNWLEFSLNYFWIFHPFDLILLQYFSVIRKDFKDRRSNDEKTYRFTSHRIDNNMQMNTNQHYEPEIAARYWFLAWPNVDALLSTIFCFFFDNLNKKCIEWKLFTGKAWQWMAQSKFIQQFKFNYTQLYGLVHTTAAIRAK